MSKNRIQFAGYDVFVKEKDRWQRVASRRRESFVDLWSEYGRGAKLKPRYNRSGSSRKS